MKMKRWIGLALTLVMAITMFAGTTSAASISTDIKVKLNGEWVIFPSPPVLLNGKTFVEFRTLFTKLGYSIDYNATTKTINAKSASRSIQMTPTGTSALVDGAKVPVNGEMKLLNGRTMVGVRFIATLSDKNVDWDGAKKTVTITDKGPTAAQQAELFAVLNGLATAEDKQDADAFMALIHSQMPLKKQLEANIRAQYAKLHTQTIYKEMSIDTYSSTEAVVYTLEQNKKISGDGFFPESEYEMYYTLRKDTNGKWAVYDIELDSTRVIDEDGMWAQEITVPDADKTALLGAVNAQVAAMNAKDLAAYKATLDPNDDGFDDDADTLEQIFSDDTFIFKATVDRTAIVELSDDSATVLVSFQYEFGPNDEEPMKYAAVSEYQLVKQDGKWLITPGSNENELISDDLE
ncbi:copper amine oxidase N-terminal domain-containing protein [Paenibacillus rhizovicinus]|uniref:Copper amine oxidase N-terminal domain-containing protein n=1 Tax=Paenibacillus rhizovicinus TaxID=2704463 RepID=A0A6C0P3C5_9BACL|nr:copper amine oxidase N-terminal domain-containing protein [Paenibacillus rhizovicinus]QHW32998.1 copper amine oxidase N-terminal domain-containing protein [Paenibacillus rhizovicinus]